MKKKVHEVFFNDNATVEVAFNDRLPLPTERIFKDTGQMIAPCVVARTGIMHYLAKECGPQFADRAPDSIVRIATFAEDLFDEDSLKTYQASPITLDHPKEQVTVENSKELMKGHLEGLPTRVDVDGESELHSTIVISDADALAEIKAGKTELSSGHKSILVMNDTGEGEWDAKKTCIKNNHTAIVKIGRAGKSVSIADSGDAVVLKDAAELTILLDAAMDNNALLKAEIVSLKDSQTVLEEKMKEMVPVTLIDSMVTERCELLESVVDFCDIETAGKSNVEIKREVLEHVYSKDFKGKPDAEIILRYEVLQDTGVPASSSEFQKELIKSLQHETVLKDAKIESPSEIARQKMIDRNSGTAK